MKIPNSEFKIRREKLLNQLPENSVAFVLSAEFYPRNGDQFFRFRQNSDLFYLTGIEQEQTILMLNPSHPKDEYREVLFIKRPNKQEERWTGKKITPDQAKQISGIEKVMFIDEFDTKLPDFLYFADTVYIADVENKNRLRLFNDFIIRFLEKLKFSFPLHTYKRLSPLITKMRLIKSDIELQLIQEAINITGNVFLNLLKYVKPGMYEYQVEAKMLFDFINAGYRNLAFEPIIAAGKNAIYLHYIYNNGVCNDKELLLIDYGVENYGYASDITRTIPINGKYSKRQLEVYQAVLDVQKQLINSEIKPGLTIEQLNEKTRQLIADKLVALGLIKESEKQSEDKIKEYFPHGVSHFLGLDVHDVGNKHIELEPGMVITVEPGIYIEEEAIGVRLENDVVITKTGVNDLSKSIPIDPQEIENLML